MVWNFFLNCLKTPWKSELLKSVIIVLIWLWVSQLSLSIVIPPPAPKKWGELENVLIVSQAH